MYFVWELHSLVYGLLGLDLALSKGREVLPSPVSPDPV